MLKIALYILAGLYAISPFDILPEAVMGWLGWFDDAIVIYLIWRLFLATGRPPWSRQNPYSQDQGTNPGGSGQTR